MPANYGTLEEVLAQKPDLVIAGLSTTPTTRALLAQSRIPLLQVPLANTFADIREVTRVVARAVGEEAKAEILLKQMDATLAELAASEPKRRIVIAGWESAGEVPGKGTLFDAILTAAGGINIAASASVRPGGFDLEHHCGRGPILSLTATRRSLSRACTPRNCAIRCCRRFIKAARSPTPRRFTPVACRNRRMRRRLCAWPCSLPWRIPRHEPHRSHRVSCGRLVRPLRRVAAGRARLAFAISHHAWADCAARRSGGDDRQPIAPAARRTGGGGGRRARAGRRGAARADAQSLGRARTFWRVVGRGAGRGHRHLFRHRFAIHRGHSHFRSFRRAYRHAADLRARARQEVR